MPLFHSELKIDHKRKSGCFLLIFFIYILGGEGGGLVDVFFYKRIPEAGLERNKIRNKIMDLNKDSVVPEHV